MYYLRTKAAADAIKFTVDVAALNRPQIQELQQSEIACSLDNRDECLACGS
jgi:hypothetical protein